MSLIEIVNVNHGYNSKQVLKGISLSIREGEIFALIGPTGAGKTTVLRLIDQLEEPASGRIYFAGEDTLDASKPRVQIRRRMAMVFQKPTLFNISVYDNVAYPLKVRGYNRKKIFKRVSRILEMVALEGYQKKSARVLSGGEAQRVALAQAMVTNPEILLLDEPTANLDPLSADVIEDLILQFNQEQGTTTLMATHNMLQGQRLADRIGVLMEGELTQVGKSEEIFSTPQTTEVAKFVGMENILKGIITSNEGGVTCINVNGRTIEGISECQTGEKAHVCIRAEDITLSLSTPQGSARNFFPGQVELLAFSGPLVRVELRCPFRLAALITKKSAQEMKLKVGKKVYVSFKATAIHIIDLK